MSLKISKLTPTRPNKSTNSKSTSSSQRSSELINKIQIFVSKKELPFFPDSSSPKFSTQITQNPSYDSLTTLEAISEKQNIKTPPTYGNLFKSGSMGLITPDREPSPTPSIPPTKKPLLTEEIILIELEFCNLEYEIQTPDRNLIHTYEKAKSIKERLETYCTTDKEGNVDLLQALVKSTYTEDKIAPELGNIDILDSISKTNDDAVLKGYLEKLDKGLHRKIVEFEIAESLGWAMLAGGILTMVAVFTTGGTALSITLVSSIVFLYLEGTFVLYDSSDWFDAYQRDLYKTPGWLLAPSELGTVEVAPEDASDHDRLIDKGTPHQTSQKQLTLGRCVSLFLTALPRTIHYLYE